MRHALPVVICVLALSFFVGWTFRKPAVVVGSSSRGAVSLGTPAAAARPVEALEHASDGVPIHPRGSAEPPPDTATHPHGFSPVHERIYRENDLLGQLDGAMDVKDVPGMRRLLARYREEYPEDSHEMQAGYALIADCLEFPDDEERRTAAQRYYDTEIESGLRRYIRRHCLERPAQ